jgi:hypothetical protein
MKLFAYIRIRIRFALLPTALLATAFAGIACARHPRGGTASGRWRRVGVSCF